MSELRLDYSDYETPPFFSLPVLLFAVVVEVGWIWILWKVINHLVSTGCSN